MVCEDIKASCMAKVAGTAPERLCYRVLNLVAFLAFLAAVASLALKANEKITEVDVEALDAMPWPVMFFCFQDVAPSVGEDDSNDLEVEIGLRMDKHKTAANHGVECNGDAAVIWSMDLGSDDSASPSRSCLPIQTRETSAMAKDLENRFKLFSKDTAFPNGRPWRCSTLNEDGAMGSAPDIYKEVQLEWFTTVKNDQTQFNEERYFVWSGILDPKIKTLAEQKETFTYFTVPLVNSYTQLTFTVDTHVEKDWTNMFTSTAVGERVKAASEMAVAEKVGEYMKDDAVKLKFNPALNTKPIAPMTAVGIGREQRNKLVFHPLNYVSRTITTRYKTWDEIWAAVGGAWATAALLVAVFYVQKEVQVPSQHPSKQDRSKNTQSGGAKTEGSRQEQQEAEVMEEVQVFRLRGVTSREEVIKSAFAMAVDAFDASTANKDALAELDAAELSNKQ